MLNILSLLLNKIFNEISKSGSCESNYSVPIPHTLQQEWLLKMK